MTQDKRRVAVTRRLPPACEARLSATYDVRIGDDARIYDPDTLAEFAAGAAALIVTPADMLTAGAVQRLPDTVRVLSCFSVGFEHVDLVAARARGLRVTNTPDVLTDATADAALLLMLGASRRASEGERILRAGSWKGLRPTFLLGAQITGKTLGIIGMGRIGAAFAQRAAACGMRVLYHNRRPVTDAGAAIYCDALDDLLRQSHVLSLHCPLTGETRGLLNAARLAQLPRGAIVINTARGGLVDDDALVEALRSGHIAAAGLDVFTHEPEVHPGYLRLENVMLLPHLGSATLETRTAMGMLAIDNIDAVLSGREPPHPVV
jgi:glyoxylate reductase